MIRIHKGQEKLDKSRSQLRVGPEERTLRRCDMRIARYIGIVHCPEQRQWLHRMSGGLRASIISGVRILAALLGGRALGGDRNMKTRYVAVVLLGLSFLFNGCASTLKLERDGPGLAETVGISSSEVGVLSIGVQKAIRRRPFRQTGSAERQRRQ